MNRTMVNVAAISLMACDAALSTRDVIEAIVEEKLNSKDMTERKAFWLGVAEPIIEVAVGTVTGVTCWMCINRK